MIINFIFGFAIPWIFGSWLYIKDRKLVLHIFPVSSMLSLAFNLLGFYFFWDFKPIFSRVQTISALPLNLGLFPVLGCFMIHYIKNTKLNAFMLIFIFSTIITLSEWIGVEIGRVIYFNDWNIIFTFFSYLTSLLLTYWYYIKIQNV